MTKKTETTAAKLTAKEKKALARHVATIRECKANETANFHELARALHEIQQRKLYRDKHKTEAALFKKEFGYSRSHSLRLAKEGGVLKRLSPMGDNVVGLFTSDRHVRPLLKLSDADQDTAIAKVTEWMNLAKQSELTSQVVESAVTYLHPPTAPEVEESAESVLAKTAHGLVLDSKKVISDKLKVAAPAKKLVFQVFDNLAKKVEALSGPRRSTGIDWTDTTWNPLQGCSRASAGCDNCYAAKDAATRLRDVYPDLAVEKPVRGKKTYLFTGKIQLLFDRLSEPLHDKKPKRYFVNSMSDLFHKNVPQEFIEAVFHVMETATWHQFQVLTKRPERMAEFTNTRYKDRPAAPNIWLGTTTENQEMFDERYPHLLNTQAAIRWLSVEPMIGPIKFSSLKGIDWVVVGGETGSDRKMEKAWAISVRDQCAKANVAFFFKQWGDFDEDGNPAKGESEKDGLTPVTLDGVVYNAYPQERIQNQAAADAESAE